MRLVTDKWGISLKQKSRPEGRPKKLKSFLCPRLQELVD